MKDIIYNYNKDAEYRDNKTKVRSLPIVLKQLHHQQFLDENMRFVEHLDPEEYLERKNDFCMSSGRDTRMESYRRSGGVSLF